MIRESNINKSIKGAIVNQHGSIMLITMLILTSILVVSMGVANIAMSQIRMSGTQARSTKAYFAAEAGAERVLWQLRKEQFDIRQCEEIGGVDYKYVDFDAVPDVACVDDPTAGGFCPSCALGNGSSYLVASSSPWITFNSKGEFNDVRRVVEVGF